MDVDHFREHACIGAPRLNLIDTSARSWKASFTHLEPRQIQWLESVERRRFRDAHGDDLAGTSAKGLNLVGKQGREFGPGVEQKDASSGDYKPPEFAVYLRVVEYGFGIGNDHNFFWLGVLKGSNLPAGDR